MAAGTAFGGQELTLSGSSLHFVHPDCLLAELHVNRKHQPSLSHSLFQAPAECSVFTGMQDFKKKKKGAVHKPQHIVQRRYNLIPNTIQLNFATKNRTRIICDAIISKGWWRKKKKQQQPTEPPVSYLLFKDLLRSQALCIMQSKKRSFVLEIIFGAIDI